MLRRLNLICLALALGLVLQTASLGGIIAQWSFEDGTFNVDSASDNDLTVSGATCITDGSGPSGDFASFDGINDTLYTASTLDLSAYDHIRIGWWQLVGDTTEAGMFWEIGANSSRVIGAFSCYNDNGTATTGVWENTSSWTGLNSDTYATTGGATWEYMVVEFDLKAESTADVVNVYRNGVSIGTTVYQFEEVANAFVNNTFYIGSRGNSSLYYAGAIDELVIGTPDSVPLIPAAVPEPSAFVMLGMLLLVGAGFRARQR